MKSTGLISNSIEKEKVMKSMNSSSKDQNGIKSNEEAMRNL